MNKNHFWCILLCLVGALTTSNYVKAQVCTVRLTVELPGPGIQKDSTVFIAGTFNNWNPSDSSCCMIENHQLKLEQKRVQEEEKQQKLYESNQDKV